MTEIELSPEQQAACDRALDWFNMGKPETPIHRVFGYAGTGKTTTIRAMIAQAEVPALGGLHRSAEIGFAAFTGKAALVMTKHGLPASTIHKLVYRLVEPDRQEFDKLKKELQAATDDNNFELAKVISKTLKEIQELTFEINPESDLQDLDLLVLDECSMVSDEVLEDLLSFNVPLLVLGDPGQLPPINGDGRLMREKPDTLFTEIHRQAAGNPIIDMSLRIRNGVPLPQGDHGAARIIQARELTNSDVLESDIMMVGKNVTRRKFNAQIRQLKGFNSDYPQVDDILICQRNNASKGLFNGQFCTVKKVIEDFDVTVRMEIETEDGITVIVDALRAYFDEYHTKGCIEGLHHWDRKRGDEFDFGYCITVHKAQGSQWDNVLFFDDGMFRGWKGKEKDRKRWLYTGVTRAAEKLLFVRQ